MYTSGHRGGHIQGSSGESLTEPILIAHRRIISVVKGHFGSLCPLLRECPLLRVP